MPSVLVAYPGGGVCLQQVTKGVSELLGGSLQCVQLENNYVLYCNHDGGELDLPANPYFSRGIVRGPFVISKTNQAGNHVGLHSDDYDFVMEAFIQNQ